MLPMTLNADGIGYTQNGWSGGRLNLTNIFSLVLFFFLEISFCAHLLLGREGLSLHAVESDDKSRKSWHKNKTTN
jgi:hypothetical protein